MLKFLVLCMLATLAYCDEPVPAPETPAETPDVEAIMDEETPVDEEGKWNCFKYIYGTFSESTAFGRRETDP